MGLFDTKKRLDDLERQVQTSPTPVNMVSLIEKYMAAGDEAKALEWARRAVERFPDSEKCAATFENIQKMRLQREIVELNQALRKNPSKTHYEKLASIYLYDLGNRNKAYELALEGVTKFPQSDGLLLICGLVRMDRFHADFLANDFTEAVRHFEKAMELNPNNFKSLMSLGRLYAEIGANDKAKDYLEQAIKVGQSDANMDKLVKLVGLKSTETVDVDDALGQIEQRRGLSPEGLEVRKIFDPAPRGATILQISPVKVEGHLAKYNMMPGYRASVVVTREGQVMASHSAGQIERDRFSALVQAILRCCEEGSKRMDIGSFVNAEIETSVGRVSIAEWKNLIIGILADVPAKKGDVDAAIEKFIHFLSST